MTNNQDNPEMYENPCDDGVKLKHTGRPLNSYKYGGPSYTKSLRLTLPCLKWVEEQGGRTYLENLVPDNYRQNIEEQFEHRVVKKKE